MKRSSSPVDGPHDVDDWNAHWTAYAPSVSENPAQAYRRRRAFELLSVGGTPRRLLDIGSGQGDLLRAARDRWPSAELKGLELSASGIAAARSSVPTAVFHQRDLLVDDDALAELDGWATHAVCSEVLEHLDDPGRVLVNARRFLAPGCTLVVTVPGGPRSSFDRHIGHRRHFRPDEVGSLLRESGYSNPTVEAAGFPTFNAYKLLVIARGAKLADDVRRTEAGNESTAARWTMRAFGPAFRLARPNSRWGWQMIARATNPV